MARQVIDIIKNCLRDEKSFILMGGAGSGKTYTLMQTIEETTKMVKPEKICCVTYTNAAADEIKRRCNYSNLSVSTLHDMLWNIIKPYQKNLVMTFKTLIQEGCIIINEEERAEALNVNRIEYQGYRKIREGIFTHDDLLIIAERMFENYPLLSKILSDKYKYIFIDEYQDTFDMFVKLSCKMSRDYRTVFGYFGDSMQSIYENYKLKNGIDNLLVENDFIKIIKDDNYRCSESVINLINKLRTDGIIQKPANYNKRGTIQFIYSKGELSLDNIKESKPFEVLQNADIKELYLTHKLIAKELGFMNYLDAFSTYEQNRNAKALGKEEKDRDYIANCLLLVAKIYILYSQKRYKEILGIIDRKIKSYEDKKDIILALNEIKECKNKNCIETLNFAIDNHLINFNERSLEDTDKGTTRYIDIVNKLNTVKFEEVVHVFEYLENTTPFSTQHNIKGLEYENVFVYLDNGRWNKYNFKQFFDGNIRNRDVNIATLKLLYVCFSRAKDNLIVYYPKPNKEVLLGAERLFGKENIHCID